MQEVHILSSRVAGLQRQLNMISDNVANLNTTGYKKLDLQFETVLSRENGEDVAHFVQDRALTVNFTSGPLVETNSPYDLAIAGEGFFAVNIDGRTEYTRNGNFVLNQNGTLIDQRGSPVQGVGGAEIVIPVDAVNVTISLDGTISDEDGELGQIGIFTFDRADMQQLQRTGNGGFVPLPGVNAAAADPDRIRVTQGGLEGSNVSPAIELITMQELSQSYQGAARLVNSVEELESTVIRDIGGGGGR